MKTKELKQLAIDISENKVFGTFHMKEHDMNNLSCVFMPSLFLNDEQRQKLKDDNVIHFYEYYDKAGQRLINGMPIFTSMSYITKDDWEKIVKYIPAYELKKNTFLNKEDATEEETTLFNTGDV